MESSSENVRLGWYHLIFEVPRTWEIIAYKADPKDGQLVLSDRHGETMRIFWKTIKGQPALTRGLLEVLGKKIGETTIHGDIRTQIFETDGWTAFLHRIGDLHGLACRYMQDARVVLYVVFPAHPDTQRHDRIRQILKSFQPNYGSERVWAAFGLDVRLPEEMDMIRVTPFPASQVMCFENRHGESVTVHRYGMMSFLLVDEDMITYFARVKGKRYLLYRQGKYVRDNKYAGVRLAYTTRGKGGIEGFMAHTWQGRVWVWRCDDLERLYCVDNNAREKNLIPDLPDRIRCQ